jgi:hypothetical protein
MKKIIAAAMIAASLMFATACSSGEKEIQVVTVTATAPAPESPIYGSGVSADDQFLDAVRSRAPEVVTVTDSTLIATGRQVCDSLNAGLPIERVLQLGLDSGLSSTTVAAVAAGAVVFYCPGADE